MLRTGCLVCVSALSATFFDSPRGDPVTLLGVLRVKGVPKADGGAAEQTGCAGFRRAYGRLIGPPRRLKRPVPGAARPARESAGGRGCRTERRRFPRAGPDAA